jgi:hypothetical protein
MENVLLFAEGLLSKQQVVDEFGIPTNLEPKLFAILKPRVGKLYFKKDVEPALEKVLGVKRPPFAEEEFSYEKEDMKVNGVQEIVSPLIQLVEELKQQGKVFQGLLEVLSPTPVDLVGTDFVAAKLGCTTQWVTEMAGNGTIPKHCIAPKVSGGRIWKFHRQQICDWLNEKKGGRSDAEKAQS